MLVERSELTIREGAEEEFGVALADQLKPLLLSVPGVNAVEFGRGVENPSKFVLLVEWENMDAHKAFNQMDACTQLRQIIRPLSTGGVMEHFEMA